MCDMIAIIIDREMQYTVINDMFPFAPFTPAVYCTLSFPHKEIMKDFRNNYATSSLKNRIGSV